MKNINNTRRQQFLYPELYQAAKDYLALVRNSKKRRLAEYSDIDLAYVDAYCAEFDFALDALMLEYTAGTPIQELKAMYPTVLKGFENWCESYSQYHHETYPEKRSRRIACPLDLKDIGSYQQLLRLIGLAVLLREDEAVVRIADQLHADRDADIVVEELLSPYVPNPSSTEYMLHSDLYDDLVGAIWEDSPIESAACMQKFLKSWYKAYRGQPWHDAHLRVGNIPENPHWANYYGYWAFEAGALSYLYELDDTPWRDHLLYPKDLVDWARSQGRPSKPQAVAATAEVLTALPGDPCPETGDWFAHQLADKTIHVEKGQPMPGPEFSETGKVIWHLKRKN